MHFVRHCVPNKSKPLVIELSFDSAVVSWGTEGQVATSLLKAFTYVIAMRFTEFHYLI